MFVAPQRSARFEPDTMTKSSVPPNALVALVAAYVEATNSFDLERLTASSAGCLSGPDFCLIFAPCGHDDPESSLRENPAVSQRADGGHTIECRPNRLRAIISLATLAQNTEK
jgi:hypothetical protein